jgi:peroxiredoxin
MKLMEELIELSKTSKEKRPTEIVKLMEQATEELARSGIQEKVLKKGDRAPEFELPNAKGEHVKLHELLLQGPVVVKFYRGNWCPYCNLELRAFQNHLPEIKALGAQIAAISPQMPDHSLAMEEKHKLEFEVLSDVDNGVARQFGIVFRLPDYLLEIYRKLGIDIYAHNGNEKNELPIPATFVIDQNGTIVFDYADPDYTRRVDVSEVLNVLSGLAKRM